MTSGTLFPVFALPPAVANRPGGAAPVPAPGAAAEVLFGPSYGFDLLTGDFLVDGAGRVVVVDAAHAWEQWVVLTLLIQRRSAAIFGPTYGLDVRALRRVTPQTRAVLEAAIEKGITDALRRHPTTAGVDSFRFRWAADRCAVRFVVRSRRGLPLPLDVTLDARLTPTVYVPDPGQTPYLTPPPGATG